MISKGSGGAQADNASQPKAAEDCRTPRRWRELPYALALGALLFSCVYPGLGAVKASKGELTLPTYPWAAVKHPYFRGTDKVNIYPYPMLDFLSRDKTNRTYRTVILENEYLRITFLPELGGKIHEVIDKTTGQPMFYVNHVIKPGLIGQCGAWTSGGVEWNTGPQGHTVGCMQPVAVEILPPEKDGSRSVAIGETERIYGTKWTVVVTLRPGRSFIEERIRIYNPTEYVRPYYFWNCTAVPNTPGFRFIYPMTLGTDHGSEKFFNWPIHEGKDLSRGTNYQDASSIFAWHCDQDFFGSYDDGADRGVVSYANHYQLPGKKAWTWGQGGFGKMHQMDLTDTDGPYNEVQTGPLLTQGEVGRLDPCEAVEWQEWWYPVHGIGGFTFANKDVAINAAVEGDRLRLRVIGSGSWPSIRLSVVKEEKTVASRTCKIVPGAPTLLDFDLGGVREPLRVLLTVQDLGLASMRLPLDLPVRKRPEKKDKTETAAELAQAGWQDYLFARFPEAETKFRKALAKDPNDLEAHTGLAYLYLASDTEAAAQAAKAAVAVNPHEGRARFALAAAKRDTDEAWEASLDPAMAIPARALVARLSLRAQDPRAAIKALSGFGPWRTDPSCRNLLGLACLQTGQPQRAVELARANLAVDPLDEFARSLLWVTRTKDPAFPLEPLVASEPRVTLDLVAAYANLGAGETAQRLLDQCYFAVVPKSKWDPLCCYWACYLAELGSVASPHRPDCLACIEGAREKHAGIGFPDRPESILPLECYRVKTGKEGQEDVYLGCLRFQQGRYGEGREMWKKAAELGAEPVIAYRALGMAAKTLDGDLKTAREWLEKANQADSKDSIVARDLARVLMDLADKAAGDSEKQTLFGQARNVLKGAFSEGKGRSDFVSLLGRAQNRLGEYAETARMLDQVRVTVWEGSREAHDLFEEAHLALGEADLKAGRAAEALAEFNRSLEYPENLATGKLENIRETHIHYLRGNALAALGKTAEARAAWKQAADEPESKDTRKEEARRKAREALDRKAVE